MDQDVASPERVIEKVKGLLKMGCHLVAGNIEGIDGLMIDVMLFGIADAQHCRRCEDCITEGCTRTDILLLEEADVGSRVVVAQPELVSLLGTMHHVHRLVVLEGYSIHHRIKRNYYHGWTVTSSTGKQQSKRHGMRTLNNCDWYKGKIARISSLMLM